MIILRNVGYHFPGHTIDFEDSCAIRYVLDETSATGIQVVEDKSTTAFMVQREYKNNEDEWKPSGNPIWITLESLLSEFIYLDSKIDRGIKELLIIKKKMGEKDIEEFTKHTLRETQEVIPSASGVVNLDE